MKKIEKYSRKFEECFNLENNNNLNNFFKIDSNDKQKIINVNYKDELWVKLSNHNLLVQDQIILFNEINSNWELFLNEIDKDPQKSNPIKIFLTNFVSDFHNSEIHILCLLCLFPLEFIKQNLNPTYKRRFNKIIRNFCIISKNQSDFNSEENEIFKYFKICFNRTKMQNKLLFNCLLTQEYQKTQFSFYLLEFCFPKLFIQNLLINGPKCDFIKMNNFFFKELKSFLKNQFENNSESTDNYVFFQKLQRKLKLLNQRKIQFDEKVNDMKHQIKILENKYKYVKINPRLKQKFFPYWVFLKNKVETCENKILNFEKNNVNLNNSNSLINDHILEFDDIKLYNKSQNSTSNLNLNKIDLKINKKHILLVKKRKPF